MFDPSREAAAGVSRKDVKALIWMLLAVAVTRLISIYCFYIYDDAFITFRYAANLVQGNGFVYNIGQRVQGTTSPLWALILAVPYGLGLGMEMPSRVLGLLCELGTAAVVFFAVKREIPGKTAVLLTFLFALDLSLAKTSVRGMESSLFLLGTVAATMLALRGKQTIAALVAGACFFLRPEALLFALCLAGFLWVEEKRFPWKAVLGGAAVILIGTGIQAWYFGDIIPQSVRGKFALPRTYEALWNVVLFPKRDPVQAILTLTALLSVPYAWKVSRFARIYSTWALVLFASWALTGAHLWMWYCVPVFFAKVLLSAIGIGRFVETAKSPVWMKRTLNPFLLSTAVILLWVTLAAALGPDKLEQNVYSPLSRWAAGKPLRGQTAYGMDFGAFGYYSGLTILDEPGLVYPPSLDRYRTDPKALLLGEKPDWAFVTRYDHNIEMMESEGLASLYDPVTRFSLNADTGLRSAPDQVSTTWVPDFILYKRR